MGAVYSSWWVYNASTERDLCSSYGYGNLGPIRFKFEAPGTQAQRSCYRFNVLWFGRRHLPYKDMVEGQSLQTRHTADQ